MFTKITNRKMTSAFLLKRLLVILGFLYLIAIPSGLLGNDKRKFEPTDLGILLIVLIANSEVSLKETLERLSSVKVTPTSFEATLKEKVDQLTEEVANQAQKQVEQDRADAEAKRFIDHQLSETSPLKVDLESLTEKISKTSASARETIYKITKDARRNAYDKRGLIERTIPVFQALIKSGSDKANYRFYAQLGYALKDQEKPDWVGAKANLDMAIKLWRQDHPTDPLPSLYCFNWVICAAETDEQPKLSQAEVDERIRAATTCLTLYKMICSNKKYLTWVERHRSDTCKICPESENLGGYCRKDYDEKEKAHSAV
jgi:hypothetical protein